VDLKREFCKKLAPLIDTAFDDIWELVGRAHLAKVLQKAQITENEIAQFLKIDTAPVGRKPTKSDIQTKRQIPLVAYVSAGEASEFEKIDLPPGLSTEKAHLYYTVRVRGDSMLPLLKEGAILVVKKESRENIINNDTVIFRDNNKNCWVKRV
jgi:phage repressor protein C with HTH and peptisase S24 domain